MDKIIILAAKFGENSNWIKESEENDKILTKIKVTYIAVEFKIGILLVISKINQILFSIFAVRLWFWALICTFMFQLLKVLLIAFISICNLISNIWFIIKQQFD